MQSYERQRRVGTQLSNHRGNQMGRYLSRLQERELWGGDLPLLFAELFTLSISNDPTVVALQHDDLHRERVAIARKGFVTKREFGLHYWLRRSGEDGISLHWKRLFAVCLPDREFIPHLHREHYLHKLRSRRVERVYF